MLQLSVWGQFLMMDSDFVRTRGAHRFGTRDSIIQPCMRIRTDFVDKSHLSVQMRRSVEIYIGGVAFSDSDIFLY